MPRGPKARICFADRRYHHEWMAENKEEMEKKRTNLRPRYTSLGSLIMVICTMLSPIFRVDECTIYSVTPIAVPTLLIRRSGRRAVPILRLFFLSFLFIFHSHGWIEFVRIDMQTHVDDS